MAFDRGDGSTGTGATSILPIEAGGTNASTAEQARTNLGIVSGGVSSVAVSGGTGISVSGSPITTAGTITVTNSAPDQTVVLTSGTGISATGTYPSFTVTNSLPMTYPSAGIAVSSGTAWGTSKTNPTGDIVGASDTQTLTNKTLTDPAIIGTILEDIFTISDGAAFEIDPGNGSVQLITLGASRTPKATNFAAGEAVTMMINDGTAYTITWTDATFGGSGVVWVGGSAPTLATTGFTVIELWKVSTTVYGALVGTVA